MKATIGKRGILHLVAALALLVCALGPGPGSVHAASSRLFPETGKTVNDPFLSYWDSHGGLAQQGYPITDAYNEKNDADGKTYLTQYFERARFEYHPEQSDTKFQVLLGLLGKEALAAKYGNSPPGSSTETVPGGDSKTFSETGKSVTGLFLSYWNTHGGLEQQGFPITEAYNEKNDADGQTYVTQYFERARFEYHPENADPQYKVLLGLVGKEINGRKQGTGGTGNPGGGGTVNPGPTATPQTGTTTPNNTLSVPGWTHIAVATNNVVFFYNSANGHGATARLNPDGSLTVLQKYPDPATGNTAFDPGLTIMAPGPYNDFFFYRRDTGDASTCQMGDNGFFGQCLVFNFPKFWADIAIDRQTGASWFLSGTDGVFQISRLNPDGNFTGLSSQTRAIIKGDSQTYPIGNGMWLNWDYGTKTGATLSINKDTGAVKVLQVDLPDLGMTPSFIASNQSTIVFYSANSHSSLIASTALDGSIVKLKSYAAPPTITQIAAALNGPYLSYSSSTGQLVVTQVAQDGTATNLQQYEYGPAK